MAVEFDGIPPVERLGPEYMEPIYRVYGAYIPQPIYWGPSISREYSSWSGSIWCNGNPMDRSCAARNDALGSVGAGDAAGDAASPCDKVTQSATLSAKDAAYARVSRSEQPPEDWTAYLTASVILVPGLLFRRGTRASRGRAPAAFHALCRTSSETT